MEIILSNTSINMFNECSLKFKFRYIDHIKESTNEYAMFGSAIHKTIETFYVGKIFSKQELLSYFIPCLEKEYKDNGYAPYAIDSKISLSGIRMLSSFYEKQKEDGFLIEPLAIEKQFYFSFNGIKFTGKIDAIFEKDGEIYIFDWKTSKNPKIYKKISSEQLTIYNIAYLSLIKQEEAIFKNLPIKTILFYLHPNLKQEIIITREDKKRFLNQSIEIQKKICEGSFVANKGDGCRYCSFMMQCNEREQLPYDPTILKEPLLDYQIEDVNKSIRVKTLLNSNDVGLGKTVETIYIGDFLKKNNKINNILVVTRTNIKREWENAIRKFSYNEDINFIDGSENERKQKWDNLKLWNISHYEAISKDNILRIFPLNWDMIVFDDPSCFYSYKTNIMNCIRRIRAEYKFVLTATPLEKKLYDIYSIIRWLNPYIAGSRLDFEAKHVVRDFFGGIKTYRQIQEFLKKIDPIFIHRTQEEAKLGLPDERMRFIYLDFEEEQKKLYDATVKNISEYLEEQIKDGKAQKFIDSIALSKFTYLREICDSTEIVSVESHSAKVKALKILLKKIYPAKVIIFSEFATMCKILKEELSYHHPIMVTGKDSVDGKWNKIQRFKKYDYHKYLICTDVLKYGNNLQFVHYLINFDLPFNWTDLKQRIGREKRKGQNKNVNVYNLVMKNSCENRIIDILDYKKKLADSLNLPEVDTVEVPKSNKITFKTLKQICAEGEENDK